MTDSILLLVLFTCLGIQAIYYIVYCIAFLAYKNKEGSTSSASIIICAQNEEENLKRLLPQLYRQVHPDFEIIVVNDRSNDGTYDFMLEETTLQSRLKMVKIDDTPDNFDGKKYALTLGIKAAKHELIVLTDADCNPVDEHWLAAMSTGMDKHKLINLGFSYYEEKKGLLNAFIRFETLWTAIQYIGMAIIGTPYMGVGRNLAYTKSLFLNNKGFGRHLNVIGGDDDLFVNRLATKSNTQVTIGTKAVVYSTPKTTWKAFSRQKIRHMSVGKRYKAINKIILGLFSLTHLVFWLNLMLLIIMQVELYLVIGSFFIKTLLVYLTFILACKKLGVRFNLWGLIFLDILFVFYYISTGTRALFTKRVRWN